jgi:hypothetical protein
LWKWLRWMALLCLGILQTRIQVRIWNLITLERLLVEMQACTFESSTNDEMIQEMPWNEHWKWWKKEERDRW